MHAGVLVLVLGNPLAVAYHYRHSLSPNELVNLFHFAVDIPFRYSIVNDFFHSTTYTLEMSTLGPANNTAERIRSYPTRIKRWAVRKGIPNPRQLGIFGEYKNPPDFYRQLDESKHEIRVG